MRRQSSTDFSSTKFHRCLFLRGSTHGVAVSFETRVVLVTRACGAFICVSHKRQTKKGEEFVSAAVFLWIFPLRVRVFVGAVFSLGSHACSCKQTPERGKTCTHTHFAEREKKRGANPFCRRKPAVVLSVRFFPSVVVAVLFLLFVGIAPGVQHGTGNHTAFRQIGRAHV